MRILGRRGMSGDDLIRLVALLAVLVLVLPALLARIPTLRAAVHRLWPWLALGAALVLLHQWLG